MEFSLRKSKNKRNYKFKTRKTRYFSK